MNFRYNCKHKCNIFLFTFVNSYLFTFVIQRFYMDFKTLKVLFEEHRESSLFGRYVFGSHMAPLLERLQKKVDVETIGTSVLGESIFSIKIGSGSKRILMWSQMHGNESTTTKAIFDLCNVLTDTNEAVTGTVLQNCTLLIIPMLNPDGSKAYTRNNANDVDLNRDAQMRTQPESRALRALFDGFQPDYCFNLHGQRTIFGAGTSGFTATVSFLAPAQDSQRSVTKTRKKAMEIIAHMNSVLQKQIPNQVGVYDDAFNLNCVGDTFQSLDVPTVLFEAGHFAKDYNREVVREYIFQSLVEAIVYISENEVSGIGSEAYFDIPENQKCFYDIIIRNAMVNGMQEDIAVQYQERLEEGKIKFVPVVEKIGNLNSFYGHKEVDAKGDMVTTADGQPLFAGFENDFVLMKNEKLSLKA